MDLSFEVWGFPGILTRAFAGSLLPLVGTFLPCGEKRTTAAALIAAGS
jgi:hypothetical protein